MSALPPRVLLVDDEPKIRRALRDLLKQERLDVVGEAAGGAEAVALVDELDPDVVLMDLRMPVMGGIEATRLIKERAPLVQVIVLTAYDEATLMEAAADVGAYCYLVKGCSPAIILDVIRRARDHRAGLEDRAAPSPLGQSSRT
jgi:NarL family two-component system response regulator LiaR